MRSITLGLVALAMAATFAAAQRTGTGAIARSGDVEIRCIDIQRRKVSGGLGDLSNLTIELWLPVAKAAGAPIHLVRLAELEAIEDDTGKLLLTKERRAFISELTGESLSRSSLQSGGRHGPLASLFLDAPARTATSIKLLKGQAVVHLVKEELVVFGEIGDVAFKPLKHDRLKELPITPTVKVEDGLTTVTLNVPKHHDRLLRWWIEKDGQEPPVISEGQSPGPAGTELLKAYKGVFGKGCSLHLAIAVTVETKTLPFEFKALELP